MMGKTKTKTLIISFLLAAVAACLSVAFVACSGGEEKDSRVYNVGEEGVYYYDATSSAEYLMTLQSGTYMISTDGAKGFSGTYSYDEAAQAISFTDSSGDKFEAAFSDDAMQLAISGTDYTFLKKVNYTVEFKDGASTVGTQSVTYGKNASKIDAEKDGYIFIGWYEDAAFTTQYGFNTAVTADTTLYAYYIEIDSRVANYEVQFISGGDVIYTTTTQNGVVYDFPETEALGWWVSATNDENELTYEYKSETLTESTKLFAVESYTLGASVYGDGLKWNTAVAAAMITVDGEVVTSTATGTSFAYDFDSLSAGRHEISVTASGATENLVYMTKALSRVSNFSVYGTTLVYNAVENAQYYYVSVTCGNPSHDHEMVYNGNTLTYDFSNCEMGPDGISFTVYAYAAGYAESVSDTFVYALILDGTAVTIDSATDTASWTAVSGATGYEVYVNGELVTTTTDTEYSLKYYDIENEITVSIKPVAPGYYSEESSPAEYTKTTLRAPEITSVSRYGISWEEIEGAVAYELNINGYLVDVEAAEEGENVPTTYLLSDTDKENISDVNMNAISVTAIGATASKNSQQSDVTYVTDTTMYSALSYADGVISWRYALAADSYTVEYEGATETVSGANSYEITFTHSGENTVSVYFALDGVQSAMAEISVTTYAVIFNSEGGTAVDTIYVAKGDTLKLDTPSYSYGTGENTFLGWYTLPNPDGLTASDYLGEGVKIENGSVFSGNSTLILYACWEVEKRSITFVAGDYGEMEEGDEAYLIPVNMENYTLPVPTVTDAAYVFMGWYSETDGRGTRYTDGDGNSLRAYTNTNVGTLYAYWAKVLTFSTVVSTVDGSQVLSVSKGSDIDMVSTVTIPSEYNGVKVGNVSASAFSNCTRLTAVYIPDTIEYISTSNNGYVSGSGAFSGCYNLEAVYIYETGEESTGKEVAYVSDGDGVLFAVDSESGNAELVYYPYAKSGSYTIPEVVYNTTQVGYASGSTLETIQVYHTVTSLAVQVFAYNYALSAITIPATVDSIGSQAFYCCYYLYSVTFEEDVTENEATAATGLVLGSGAFQKCTGLTSVALPARLAADDFSRDAFDGCSSLANISVAAESTTLSSVNGLLCNKAGNEIIYCPPGKGGEITISGSITRIGEGAFAGNTQITGVTIPASVTEIGANAFKNCTKMEYVTFLDDLNSASELSILDGAFYGLTSTAFEEVDLPSRLVKLGENAFGGSTRLLTVKVTARSTTTSVDFAANAFGTTGSNPSYTVTTVYLDAYVPEFDIAAVFGTKLEHVYVEEGNAYFSSDANGVVYNAGKTSILYYPLNLAGAYEVPNTVTAISASVFEGRTGLTSVVIPTSVVSIGERAFYGCRGLTSVTFADGGTGALTIAAYAFGNCTYLTSISFPERTETIADYALYGCSRLTEVTLPSSVKWLGEYGAGGELTSMNVFDGCSSLEGITVAGGNSSFMSSDGILYTKGSDGKSEELIFCPDKNAVTSVTVSSSVTHVWDEAFRGNATITEITFEGEVTEKSGTDLLGANVFREASALTTVKLPVGLSKIPDNTFRDCTALTDIEIPYTVAYVGASAFYGCTSLSEVTFAKTPRGETEVFLEFADGSYTGNGKGSASHPYIYTFYGIFSYCPLLKTIELPERTTYIGEYMFAGRSFDEDGSVLTSNSGLTSVTIGAGVTEIGAGAFLFADGLGAVTFAGESSLEKIDEYAFAYTPALSDIEIPDGVTTIESYAFGGSGLESITLPASITTISAACFSACTNLSAVQIPAGVEKIGGTSQAYGAFDGCTGLKTVTFAAGSKLEEIQTYAFRGCTALETIEIPANVKSIGAYAFQNCKALKSVTFAKNEDGLSELSSVGDYAFMNTGLTSFEFPETTAESMTLGTAIFRSCGSLTSVTLSAAVTDLGTALSGCNGLTEIKFNYDETGEQTNTNYRVDGTYPILYDYDRKTITLVYGEIKGELTIPYYVTEISAGAFQNQVSMTAVYIPTSVETIGDNAFNGCRALAHVYFCKATYTDANGNQQEAAAAQSVTVGQAAFAYCTSLVEINLSADAVTSVDDGATLDGTAISAIGNGAFEYDSALTSVTLGGAVTTIGQYMFAYCTSLVSIEIPETVTAISAYAFYGAGLKSIEIPDSVTSIGERAFAYSALESADLSGYASTSLPNYLFLNCESLKEVTFGSGLTSTGTYVFQGCSSLETVIFPSTLTTMSDYAFDGCSSLFTVACENDGFEGADEGVIDISSITSLGTYAFNGCSSIVEVRLSESLVSIGASTFCGCSSLKTIDLSHVTTMSGTAAFYGCTSLEYVDISSVGGTLGDQTFYGCASLETVVLGTSLTSIGSSANNDEGVFRESGLKTLTYVGYTGTDTFAIPSSVTTVGKYAFAYTPLESVVVPNVVYSSTTASNHLGLYMFQNCENLTSVSFASGAEAVSNFMFAYCTALEEIVLPESVTTICAAAFQYSGLTSIEMPGVTTMTGNYTFQGCPLKSIKLGSKIEDISSSQEMFEYCEELESADLSEVTFNTIPSKMFTGCTSLKTVILSSTITSIKSNAFQDCTSLETINTENVKSFGNVSSNSCQYIFDGCTSLKAIDLSNLTDGYIGQYFMEGCTSLESVMIPASITNVDAYAFSGCTSLSSVTFAGNKVTTIAANAFNGCSSLKEIVLPETLTTIGNNAFRDSGLTSISIPAGVTSIAGRDVFAGCVDLDEIIIDPSNATYMMVDGFLCDMSGVIITYSSSILDDGALVIPEGLRINSAGYGFYQDTRLRSVTIPGSAETIPQYTFYNCTNLETVIIGEGVTEIGNQAFRGCESLAYVSLPSTLVTLGTYVFYNNYALASIELPEGLESIGNYCFYTSGLKSIELPSAVTTLGTYVFRYCTDLETVTLNEGLTSIGDYTFADCTSLVGLVIPSTVVSLGTYLISGSSLKELTVETSYLGDNSFRDALELERVTLADGTETINTYSFYGCTSLAEIYIPSSVTAVGTYAFDGCSALDKVTGGDGIEEIGDYAFRGTGALEGFAFTENTRTIGESAFADSKIESVILYDSIDSVGANAFDGWDKTQTIYVACSYYEAFRLWAVSVSVSVGSSYLESWLDGCGAAVVYDYVG